MRYKMSRLYILLILEEFNRYLALIWSLISKWTIVKATLDKTEIGVYTPNYE